MTTEQTFRQYLEGLLGLQAEDPKVAERLVTGSAESQGLQDSPYFGLVRAKARAMDRQEKIKDANLGIREEDFIIEQLPSSMRLTQPIDLVDATKRFYEARGLKLREVQEQNRDWEKMLYFDRPESGPAGFVQLDLGPGFGRHEGKYELWVTSTFD